MLDFKLKPGRERRLLNVVHFLRFICSKKRYYKSNEVQTFCVITHRNDLQESVRTAEWSASVSGQKRSSRTSKVQPWEMLLRSPHCLMWESAVKIFPLKKLELKRNVWFGIGIENISFVIRYFQTMFREANLQKNSATQTNSFIIFPDFYVNFASLLWNYTSQCIFPASKHYYNANL